MTWTPPLPVFAAPPHPRGWSRMCTQEPRFEAPPPPACNLPRTSIDEHLLPEPVFVSELPPVVTFTAARPQGGHPQGLGDATRTGEVPGPTNDLPSALTCEDVSR